MFKSTYSKEEVDSLINNVKNELIQHINTLLQKNKVLEETVENLTNTISQMETDFNKKLLSNTKDIEILGKIELIDEKVENKIKDITNEIKVVDKKVDNKLVEINLTQFKNELVEMKIMDQIEKNHDDNIESITELTTITKNQFKKLDKVINEIKEDLNRRVDTISNDLIGVKEVLNEKIENKMIEIVEDYRSYEKLIDITDEKFASRPYIIKLFDIKKQCEIKKEVFNKLSPTPFNKKINGAIFPLKLYEIYKNKIKIIDLDNSIIIDGTVKPLESLSLQEIHNNIGLKRIVEYIPEIMFTHNQHVIYEKGMFLDEYVLTL